MRKKNRLTRSYEMGQWDGLQANEQLTFGSRTLYQLGYRHGAEARRAIFNGCRIK